jgi:RimJ/RimL family protein N-acetyltransferase
MANAATASARGNVLLEAADAGLARRAAHRLRRAGFRVSRCAGQRLGGTCPLLAGGACPLVDGADVVVHALPDGLGQAVLRALNRAGPPVLALTGPGAAPAAPGADRLGVELVPGRLVEEVGRTLASRARLLRLPLRLRDGRAVWVRAIDAADADRLREFDGGLSERSRQLRYFGWKPPMTCERAAKLAAVDFRDRFALVAVADRDGRAALVADCRLIPMTEREGGAEIAIAVADGYQNAGLGREMLGRMLDVAADRGFAEVVAHVRYDNDRMMRLLRELGFERTGWDLGVVTFTAGASPLIPSPPEGEGQGGGDGS